jgi:hypothetical protein
MDLYPMSPPPADSRRFTSSTYYFGFFKIDYSHGFQSFLIGSPRRIIEFKKTDLQKIGRLLKV